MSQELEITTIPVTKETRNKLKDYARKSEKYNDAILRLLSENANV